MKPADDKGKAKQWKELRVESKVRKKRNSSVPTEGYVLFSVAEIDHKIFQICSMLENIVYGK